jgi:hypothetical protein
MGGFIQISWHSWRWCEDFQVENEFDKPTWQFPLPCPDKDCSICYKEKNMTENVITLNMEVPCKPEVKIEYVKHPEKGALQMMQILDFLEGYGEKAITLNALWDALDNENLLTTKQTARKVYRYYHSTMLKNRYIKVVGREGEGSK